MTETITSYPLDDGIWVFNEPINGIPQTDAYLVVGENRALIIDSLMDAPTLYEIVRGITDLPLDVLITHGHPDHAGTALQAFHEAGCSIFMADADLYMLRPGIEAAWFKPLSDGMAFDIGGRKLEAVALPGHTPGSILLFDRANQLLFTGDAIGSGVFWMQISSALPLRVFLTNLEGIWERFKDYSDLKIHPGHRNQAPVQLTRDFLHDVLIMTGHIVSGKWVGEDAEMDWGGAIMKFKTLNYNLMVNYCYNPENI